MGGDSPITARQAEDLATVQLCTATLLHGLDYDVWPTVSSQPTRPTKKQPDHSVIACRLLLFLLFLSFTQLHILTCTSLLLCCSHNASAMSRSAILKPISMVSTRPQKPQPQFIAARAFFLTLLLICAYTTWRVVLSGNPQGSRGVTHSLLRRDGASLDPSDRGQDVRYLPFLQLETFILTVSNLVPPRSCRKRPMRLRTAELSR